MSGGPGNPCIFDSVEETTTRKRACTRDVQPSGKRSSTDRETLGDHLPEAQHDRGRPLGSSPNSRQRRGASSGPTSPYSQDRDVTMDKLSYIGMDVSKQRPARRLRRVEIGCRG